jgi:hypothetical protein
MVGQSACGGERASAVGSDAGNRERTGIGIGLSRYAQNQRGRTPKIKRCRRVLAATAFLSKKV